MPIYRNGVEQGNVYVAGVAKGNVYRDGVLVFSSVVTPVEPTGTPFHDSADRLLFASLRTVGDPWRYNAGTGAGSDDDVLAGSRDVVGFDFRLRRIRIDERLHFTGAAGGVDEMLNGPVGILGSHSVYIRPSEHADNPTPLLDTDPAWLEFPFIDLAVEGGGFVRWTTTTAERTYLDRYLVYNPTTRSVFDFAFNVSGIPLPS